MHSTLKPKPTDDPHDFVVVAPDAVRLAPVDEELSNLLQEAARYRADTQTHLASDFPDGPTGPPVDTTFRPAAVHDVLVQGEGWSVVRSAVRAFTALLLAACIGVAAIAWQSSGDLAKKMITKWAPQFALTSLLSPEKPGLSAQPAASSVQVDAANEAPTQSAPPAQSAAEAVAPAAAAPSPDSAQLLPSMARDLASLGQEVERLKASVEQLKAGQQQMSRDVVAKASEVKASEQSLRPRISALPPRPAAARARKPIASSPPAQDALAPAASQAPAPYYVPRQIEPQRQPTAETLTDPELSSVPRPPMPVR